MEEGLSSSLAAAARDFEQVLKTGEVRKWWRALDRNGNGLVSQSEVGQFMSQRYPALSHGVTLKRAFYHATKREGDGDDLLDEFELPAFLRNMIYFTHVRHLCDAADKDGDEHLSLPEFTSVALAMGVVQTLDDAASAFREADQDGSGQVRLDELCLWAAEHCCPIEGTRAPPRTLRGKRAGILLQLNMIQVSLLNDLNFTGEQSVHIIASLGNQTFTSGKLTRPACVYRWAVTRGSGIVAEFALPSLRSLVTGPPLYVRVFQTECKIQDPRLQITHRRITATRELGTFTLSVAQMFSIREGIVSALECTKLINSQSCPERVLRKSHLRIECAWQSTGCTQAPQTSGRPQSAPTTPRKRQELRDLAGCFFSARRSECAQCPMSARQMIDLKRRLGAW